MANKFQHGSCLRASVSAAIAIGIGAVTATVASDSLTPFTEEALARGIDYQTTGGDQAFGFGLAFVDLDGDADADVITVGKSDGRVGVYSNDGTGHFTDRSFLSGVPSLSAPSGVAAGDYDGDGDLDLYFSNWMVPDILTRNDGDFHFTDVTSEAALGYAGPGTGVAWGDFDNDGWLDLYVANYTDPSQPAGQLNRLYRNLGDGRFDDVSASYGVDDPRPSFQPIFFDMDRDGDADLYLSNDKGPNNCTISNRLFMNVDGSFTEITESSGTAACIDSMGVAVGDFDGDGFQDLYCTNTAFGNPLFLGDGGGVFAESSEEAGVESFMIGWGAAFADFDNDGHQDLYVCNFNTPNRLYMHAGSFPCADVAGVMNVAGAGGSYAMAVADIDADGDLDLMVQDAWQHVRLYINHEGESRRWVRFMVAGRGANRFGVGAVVEVRVGETQRIREVIAGNNYKSQNELILHFGLGNSSIVDETTVMWPGGLTRTVLNLTTKKTWTLYPPEQLGDGDYDGAVDQADYVIFGECNTGSLPGLLVPGCEMMDFDGDGDVDLLDFGGLQARFGDGS